MERSYGEIIGLLEASTLQKLNPYVHGLLPVNVRFCGVPPKYHKHPQTHSFIGVYTSPPPSSAFYGLPNSLTEKCPFSHPTANFFSY